MESLWPDEIASSEQVRSPVQILKEQASLLGKMTKNILLGEIQAVPTGQPNSAYAFNILAPSLRNYRYSLFTINYNILNIYPVYIVLDDEIFKEIYSYKSENKAIKIDYENEFITTLKNIFRSNKVKQILTSLMVESGAMSSNTR
ncbi:MAG: hypothetical protein PHS80_00655 [Methanothrix sp.]|nr:hypothetical protein [Methanothrix sp.]MDD4448299.1 hypothetical protein [Methanothrix sp.]